MLIENENEKLHNYKTIANLLAFLTSIIIFVLAFALSVNAEGNDDSSNNPVIDGHSYLYFEEFLNALGVSFSADDEYLQEYFDQFYDGQELPEDLVVPILEQSISDLFVRDLSNNPLLIESSYLNKSVSKYYPIYDNNSITGWETESVSLSSCNFTYYALMKNFSNNSYTLYLFDDSAPILLSSYNNYGYHTDGFYSVPKANESNRLHTYYAITFDSSNRANTSSAGNSLYYPTSRNIGAESSPDFLFTYSLYSHICYSNLFCYATSPLERMGSLNGNQKLSYLDGDEYISDVYGSPDYLIPKKSDVSPSEDESDVFPDGSGGSNANNLYLKGADFIFKHDPYYPPYNVNFNAGQDHIPNGNIIFTGVLNDYQIEHADEFDLVFDFTLDFDVNYKNWDSAFSLFKKTSRALGNQKNLKLNFKTSNDYICSLSDFISNNNQYTLIFADVFDDLESNDITLSTLLGQMRELVSVEYNVFNLYCNVHLVSNGSSSGGYTEYYNPINKLGLTTDESIKTNKTPYIVTPSEQASDDPDTTNIKPKPSVPGPAGTEGLENNVNSNSSSSTGAITITNNNTNNYNPTNTLNGSDGSPFSNLINKLFGDGTVSEGSIGDNTVESLDGVVGANGFLRYMNQTLTWIPSSVWAEISVFVAICLGILVAGFILRIILDFL